MNIIPQVYRALFRLSQRAWYLPALRIYLAFHILKKEILQWPYLQLLYGRDSFVEWSSGSFFGFIPADWFRDHYLVFHIGFSIAAILMAAGVGGRMTILLVCLCEWILQAWQGYTLNGGDNLLKFVLLYLSFVDSFQAGTVFPTVIRRGGWRLWNNFVTNVGIWAILLHQCLVYLISGMAKANAAVWYKGIALYYTLQLERFHGSVINDLLVLSPFLVTFMTYSTLLWELLFPFLVWVRQLKLPLLFFGIGLHLGIYLCMMIHDFEAAYVAIYGLYITRTEWDAIRARADRYAHSLARVFRKTRRVPVAMET